MSSQGRCQRLCAHKVKTRKTWKFFLLDNLCCTSCRPTSINTNSRSLRTHFKSRVESKQGGREECTKEGVCREMLSAPTPLVSSSSIVHENKPVELSRIELTLRVSNTSHSSFNFPKPLQLLLGFSSIFTFLGACPKIKDIATLNTRVVDLHHPSLEYTVHGCN